MVMRRQLTFQVIRRRDDWPGGSIRGRLAAREGGSKRGQSFNSILDPSCITDGQFDNLAICLLGLSGGNNLDRDRR